MRDIVASSDLVAYCGLYCGACKSYLKGRCDGCHKNEKATWCSVRAYCRNGSLSSCAACKDHPDPRQCAKFNNFMSRLFAFVFSSDRPACIDQIRRLGLEGHAESMASLRLQSIKRSRA